MVRGEAGRTEKQNLPSPGNSHHHCPAGPGGAIEMNPYAIFMLSWFQV